MIPTKSENRSSVSNLSGHSKDAHSRSQEIDSPVKFSERNVLNK